jgi:hypothetical protein
MSSPGAVAQWQCRADCPNGRQHNSSWAQRDGRVPLYYEVDSELASFKLAASGALAEWGACVSTGSRSSESSS